MISVKISTEIANVTRFMTQLIHFPNCNKKLQRPPPRKRKREKKSQLRSLHFDIEVEVWGTQKCHNPMTRQKKKEEKSSLDYIFWQNYLVYPNCRVIWVDVIEFKIRQAHKLQETSDW